MKKITLILLFSAVSIYGAEKPSVDKYENTLECAQALYDLDIEKVQELIDADAIDRSTFNNLFKHDFRMTPLIYAAAHYLSEIIPTLAALPNTNVNEKDDHWCNALLYATHNGDIKMIKELLKLPNIDVSDPFLLFIAITYARNWNIKIVRELIAAGATIKGKDGYGNNLLMELIQRPYSAKRDDLIRIFLAAGVDPYQRNKQGQCAADFIPPHLYETSGPKPR